MGTLGLRALGQREKQLILSEKAYQRGYINLDLEGSDGNKISRPENGGKATNEQFSKSIYLTRKIFRSLRI